MRKLLLTIFCLASLNLLAQVTNEGKPVSWDLMIDYDETKKQYLPSFDLNKVKNEDKINDNKPATPWRFGYMHSVDYGFEHGQWTEFENGDRIWRILISSTGALTLNFLLDDFYMPKGGKMYLYNNERTDLLGAYDYTQNTDTGTLGTWLVEGDSVWIEYFEPKEVYGLGRIHIAKATHGYRTSESYKQTKALNGSGNCNLDVNCPIGDDWEDFKEHNKKSVALMLSNGTSFCTGALVNNTENDGTPYFLTANHCLSTPQGAFGLALLFGWISPNTVCAAATPNTNGPMDKQTQSGATLRANSGGSDFSLVEMNNPIPAEWDRVYAGWDNRNITPEHTVGIHHPSGDVMKVCRDDDAPGQTVWGQAQCWEILGGTGGGWELGVTEGGSSGSPLFNQEGKIIGQLFGGGAACSGTVDNGQYDVYGRFDISWEGGGTSSTRLKDWLDPNDTGVTDMNSYPSLVLNANDIGVSSIDSPVSGILTDSEAITVSITNFGENTASNFEVSYSVNGGSSIVETYSGSIASEQTVQYTFNNTADMSTVGETYSITVSTVLSGDEDLDNDSISVDVTNLNPNDIGVSEFLSPSSGELLSNAETVTVTITNYGGASQSNFDVSYQINDGSVVTETVAGPIDGNSSLEYTFTQSADLSAFGIYNFTSYTSLDVDSNSSNDSSETVVVNNNCTPSFDCELGDGLQLFQLGDIDNTSGCEGYGDFTNLSTDLAPGETYDVTMTTGWGNQFVRIWIDYNDDYTFTEEETILNNYVLGTDTQQTFTETTQITIPSDANFGQHLMRVKTAWGAEVPADGCDDSNTFGETEDYTVNILPASQNDLGVVGISNPITGSLSNAETITIQLLNSGENDASDFEVSFSIDGGTAVVETFSGTIASGQSAEYSFTATADLSTVGASYIISATVSLNGDENAENDTFEVTVEHLNPIDLGVTSMISPVSGVGLTDSEVVTVEITNFGGSTISNFEVSYDVNGIVVTETVNVPFAGNSTIQFTFDQTVDLSSIGSYEFTCYTSIVGDADDSNDSSSVNIAHVGCQPITEGQGCNIDGIKRFVLGTIDADDGETGCNSEFGYVDRTDLSTELDRDPMNSSHILQAQHNWTANPTGEALSVWIDFNDNGVFEDDERLISGELFTVAGELDSFTLPIPADAPLGTHILRAKAIDVTVTGGPANVLDPCANYTYGEVHDYTVEIVDSLMGIGDIEFAESQFIIYSNNNLNFDINLITDYNEKLNLSIYDINGRIIISDNLYKTTNSTYTYDLNMASYEAGVYLVRLGNSEIGFKTERIIVR